MPKTLLLADDSVVIQKLVGLSFANEDIDLITVDNGDDAVARALESRPDLVLADVVMPGKSGYEVCKAIKEAPELAGTPVLLLTGTFEAFDELRAQAAGSDGHITKPFEAHALVETVNSMLARPQSEAEAPAPAEPVVDATPESTDAYDFFEEEPAASLESELESDSSFVPANPPEVENVSDPLGDFTMAPAEGLEALGVAPGTVNDDLFGTSAMAEPVFASEAPPLMSLEEIEEAPYTEAEAMTVLAPDPLFESEEEAVSPATEEPEAIAIGEALPAAEIDAADLTELEPLNVGTPLEDVALFGDAEPLIDPPADVDERSGWTDSNLDIGAGESFTMGAPTDPPSVEALEALDPGSPPEVPTRIERDPVDDSQFDISSSDLGDLVGTAPVEPPPSQPEALPTATAPAQQDTGASLSPASQQQIHDVIEKVAWEAFSDVSETLVKQVVERVEKIAWEVVPQMAEALIQEEIRRMKGES